MSTANKLCFIEVQEEYEKIFKIFCNYTIVAKSDDMKFFNVPKRNKETDINCILPTNFLNAYSYKPGLPEFLNPYYTPNAKNYYGAKTNDKLYPTKLALQLDDDLYNLLLKFWAEKLENITKTLTPAKARARVHQLEYLKIIKDPSFLNEIVISEIIT